MSDSEKSITWIVTAVMIVVAVFGWGFLAGSYAGAHTETQFSEGRIGAPAGPNDQEIHLARRPGRGSVIAVAVAAAITFTFTAVQQLPNFFSVMLWHLSNRIWLPGIIVGLEVLVFIGGFFLKSLERQLAQPYRKRR